MKLKSSSIGDNGRLLLVNYKSGLELYLVNPAYINEYRNREHSNQSSHLCLIFESYLWQYLIFYRFSLRSPRNLECAESPLHMDNQPHLPKKRYFELNHHWTQLQSDSDTCIFIRV